MQLISEIIDLLSDEKSTIQSALLKAQVLAHRLGNADLKVWVENELRGYASDATLPEYRVLKCALLGTMTNGVYTYENERLPIASLSDDLLETLTRRHVRDSISTIERWVGNDALVVGFGPEVAARLSRELTNGYRVESVRNVHSVGAIEQMVTQIRSRLLEFCLDISDDFSAEMSTQEARTKAQELGSQDLFRNAVFGDGATVIVNGGEIASVNNTIIKSDLASLLLSLKKVGVSQSDLATLETAIAQDGVSDPQPKAIGPRVRDWIGGMVTKAGTSAWEISIGTAGSLLATAIQKYYGL